VRGAISDGRPYRERIFPGEKTVGKKTVSLNWAIFLKALDGWQHFGAYACPSEDRHRVRF
jgi:hypothetical protein